MKTTGIVAILLIVGVLLFTLVDGEMLDGEVGSEDLVTMKSSPDAEHTTVETSRNNSSAVLIDAPHIQQLPELPRGCEVTSLSMMLQHAGVDVDKMTLAKEVKKVPYQENGLYGNPNEGFVGNMYTYDEPGLSVYHEPLEELANQYMPNQVKNLTGSNLDEIKESLSNESPVLVILASTYDEVPEETWETWETKNGTIQVSRKIHSVLVTGFNKHSVFINDPLHPTKNRPIDIENFKTAWEEFGNQAIALASVDQ
ncbi:C39 family peptidase [Pontibacillus yanchengensis]|uniref:Peptidase C39-like domain-containing protein n=1 Tax=Pontibacillus yanchengensis Y32 TaxID=1385514 RepID=A0A0A2TAP3_9BACI|nr:C39 family peptidase [Pontibacillus yanchengensis]KGP72847.1 hypothetical protein N782_10280 [Pontibacillus yanchengensis Y32]